MVDAWGSWVNNSSYGDIRLGVTITPYVYSDRVDFYLGVYLEAQYAIADTSNLFSISGDWSRSASSISVNIGSGGGTQTLWSNATSSGHLYRVYGSPGQTVSASVSAYIDNLYAYNNKASVSRTESATIPAVVPSAPTLTATAASSSQINLSWTAPSNGGSAITSYTVQYSTNGTTWYSLTSTDDTVRTYNNTGLGKHVTRYYRVAAVNGVGTGAWSATKSATTLATVPGVPTGPYSETTVSDVFLSWVAPTDTGGVALSGYKIYRDGSLIATVGASSLDYTDTTVAPAHLYSYDVYAYNSVGDSADSLYFELHTVGGVVKVWHGTAYITVLPKAWNGTAWVDAQARIYDGVGATLEDKWKYGI